MNERIENYLKSIFSQYEDVKTVRELKDEISVNLQDRFDDLVNAGHDEETAYKMTVDSLGDISEIVDSIAAKTKTLQKLVHRDYSSLDMSNSDLRGVFAQNGKFDNSSLRDADLSGADLTNGSFKAMDLRNVKFEGANLTGAVFKHSDLRNTSFINANVDNTEFNGSDLTGASFEGVTLVGANFHMSDLNGTSFRNAVIQNVNFKNSDPRKAIFDGATMDKLTYALLKGYKANMTNVNTI
ncbi:pentapeptide repeat-containing protein [bacterium]|nr:pentapeptide repeat-containing protein [bacterium]